MPIDAVEWRGGKNGSLNEEGRGGVMLKEGRRPQESLLRTRKPVKGVSPWNSTVHTGLAGGWCSVDFTLAVGNTGRPGGCVYLGMGGEPVLTGTGGGHRQSGPVASPNSNGFPVVEAASPATERGAAGAAAERWAMLARTKRCGLNLIASRG